MSWHNKVIWSEGLFIRPQHFQQQDRYVEYALEGRCRDLRAHGWGIRHLKLDKELLLSGKLAVLECRAVLSDGTVMDFPADTPPPAVREIPPETKDEVVYVCLPLRREYAAACIPPDNKTEHLARYVQHEYEVPDNNADAQSKAPVRVGRQHLCLKLEHEERTEYTCLGVARIQGVQNGKVVLDEGFIPPTLNCHATQRLNGFVKEITGLLHNRGEAMAKAAVSSGHTGIGELVDYMWLQVINRNEPLFLHFQGLEPLHPEDFYRCCIQLAGELSTFAHDNRRPLTFPIYDHENLDITFQTVMEDLRRLLSFVVDPNVFQIPLEYQGPGRGVGLYVAAMQEMEGMVNVRALLDKARFILTVQVELPADIMQNEFPKQVKIGPVESINRMVHLNLGGVKIQMSAPPRQLPYHAGYTYFELDQSGRHWEDLSKSNGLAVHLGDKYQDVKLELWAIKR